MKICLDARFGGTQEESVWHPFGAGDAACGCSRYLTRHKFACLGHGNELRVDDCSKFNLAPFINRTYCTPVWGTNYLKIESYICSCGVQQEKSVVGRYDIFLHRAGVNFMEKTITLRNTEITFSIWDLGGQREFLSMLPLVRAGGIVFAEGCLLFGFCFVFVFVSCRSHANMPTRLAFDQGPTRICSNKLGCVLGVLMYSSIS